MPTYRDLAIDALLALPETEAEEISIRILAEVSSVYRAAFALLARARMRRKAA